MDYISAQEAAQQWGISLRHVQTFCTQGRVPGAKKIGNAWAIPEGTPRPGDFRNPKVKAKARAIQPLSVPLPLTNAIFPLGGAKEFAIRQDSPLVLAEYHFYSGSAKEAAALAEGYLEDNDLSLRLSACLIYALASLSLGKPENTFRAKAIIDEAYNTLNADTPREQQALVVFFTSAFCTFLHIPRPPKMPELQYFMSDLRGGIRYFSMTLQAWFAYLSGLYGTAIGIAETVLVLEDTRYPIASIYLHLICALCYQHTHYPQQARHHIFAAWEEARQDGLYQPFAQMHPFFSGMLEVYLKKSQPEDFRKITALTAKHLPSWCAVHNAITGEQIPGKLTPNEFTIAALASRNRTNREISEYLDISESTVKNAIASILDKLNIANRKELTNFMPR